MKNLDINEPCSEKWNEMTPTEKGAFCQKCAKHVIDFTNKTNAEIKATFLEMAGKTVCGKIGRSQMEAFNTEEAQVWQLNTSRGFQRALVFSMVVVFGLSLFSCSNDREKKFILEMQHTIGQTLNELPAVEAVPEEAEIATVEVPVVIEAVMPVEIEYQTVGTNHEELDEISVISRLERSVVGMMVYHDMTIDVPPYIEEVIEYDENGIEIPKVFMSKAYPNPAVISTTLEIGLPENDFAEIGLYDLGGRFIQPVFTGDLKRGTHSFLVDISDLPSGMYLFAIRSRKYSDAVRILKN